MKYIRKSPRVMGDYIALHNRAGHIPRKFKRIPKNTVWIRSDHYDNKLSRNHIIHHEQLEHHYMKQGLNYKQSHYRTSFLYP